MDLDTKINRLGLKPITHEMLHAIVLNDNIPDRYDKYHYYKPDGEGDVAALFTIRYLRDTSYRKLKRIKEL